MTIFKPSRLGIAALLALGLHIVPAQAVTVRTFIASTGSDANTTSNCPRTAPCRTLAQAATVTQAGGEIVALDAAGYGPITITQALSIVSVDGAFIAVPSGGTGITINAGVNDAITIDGLIIDGAGVGNTGIVFNTGKSLTVTKSVIRGLTGTGILFQPNASSALRVSNSVLTNNAARGIDVAPTGSGAVTASLSRVELYNNNISGLSVFSNTSTGTITAVVADSVAANNTSGFRVTSTSVATRLMVIRTVVANNTVGLLASGAAATLRVGQSTLTGNGAGWQAVNSATLRSYADNNIDGNDDGDPTPTAIGKK